MKKITILLLALLLIVSCFAFASCEKDDECPNGGSHDYTNIYGEPSAYCQKCGAQKSSNDSPSIGGIIALGAVSLVVSLILHWIGIQNSSAFFLRAPLIVFVIFTFGAFLTEVVYGIIMAVFLVIYVVLSIRMNRRYLGYDDYV